MQCRTPEADPPIPARAISFMATITQYLQVKQSTFCEREGQVG